VGKLAGGGSIGSTLRAGQETSPAKHYFVVKSEEAQNRPALHPLRLGDPDSDLVRPGGAKENATQRGGEIREPMARGLVGGSSVSDPYLRIRGLMLQAR